MCPHKIPILSDRDKAISSLEIAKGRCILLDNALTFIEGFQNRGAQSEIRIVATEIRSALKRLENVDSFDEKELPLEAK